MLQKTPSEKFPFVVNERAHAERLHGIDDKLRIEKGIVYAGTEYPSVDTLTKLAEQSQQLATKVDLGYSRAFRRYVPETLVVEALRDTPLTNLMSRIGLQNLIPYKKVETVRVQQLLDGSYVRGTYTEI